MKAFLGFTLTTLRSKSASDSPFRRAVPRMARAWTWCQLERLDMRAKRCGSAVESFPIFWTKKWKKPWTPLKKTLRSPTFFRKKTLIKSWLPAAALCRLATLRFWCECATQHQMSWKKHEPIEGETESRLGLSWSPYHRKAGKNWSPKTLNINILLVKRSQKERPRLEMTGASGITCALKMNWKLKTAHRTIRCGMPWASQQGSILFLQRKLTIDKASGFFTPAELIWEAPTCGNFMQFS